MSKKIKEMELSAMRTTLHGIKDYIVVEPVKVDSATEFEFRKQLRAKKISVKLVKNTYAKKVLAENGVTIDAIWNGPTLLCWGGDSVKGLANSVSDLIKDLKKDPKAPDKYKIKTAVSDGSAIAMDLAKTLPTRLEAIGDVLGGLLAAGSNIVSAITAPGADLAGILKAIEDKAPAGGEAVPAAEAPPATAG